MHWLFGRWGGTARVTRRRWRSDVLQLLFTSWFRLGIFQKSLTPPLLPTTEEKAWSSAAFHTSQHLDTNSGKTGKSCCCFFSVSPFRKFRKLGIKEKVNFLKGWFVLPLQDFSSSGNSDILNRAVFFPNLQSYTCKSVKSIKSCSRDQISPGLFSDVFPRDITPP